MTHEELLKHKYKLIFYQIDGTSGKGVLVFDDSWKIIPKGVFEEATSDCPITLSDDMAEAIVFDVRGHCLTLDWSPCKKRITFIN